jgi:PhzF family phenazine biosynthesis protein
MDMKIKMYQVDAFAGKLFSGNPAAVCILDKWLPDDLMQNIAMENNLAETAFIVNEKEGLHIRWFTPKAEVALCGHATLASGHVIFNHLNEQKNEISFQSRSCELKVRKEGKDLVLNFPADTLREIGIPENIAEAIGLHPVEAYKGKTDYMLIYQDQSQIESIQPDFRKLKQTNARGIIVTAPGKESDFVSRFFAPAIGVDEDPVTGSAHTSLIPYWSKRLGKTEMTAIQLSSRRGYLKCNYLGDRVEIGGQAVTYLIGEIDV